MDRVLYTLYIYIYIYIYILFFSVAQKPKSGLGPLIIEVYRSNTIRHTHKTGRTPVKEWSALRKGHCPHSHNKQRDEYPCPQRDSNPQSQQSSGHKPTSITARPLGSVDSIVYRFVFIFLLLNDVYIQKQWTLRMRVSVLTLRMACRNEYCVCSLINMQSISCHCE